MEITKSAQVSFITSNLNISTKISSMKQKVLEVGTRKSRKTNCMEKRLSTLITKRSVCINCSGSDEKNIGMVWYCTIAECCYQRYDS